MRVVTDSLIEGARRATGVVAVIDVAEHRGGRGAALILLDEPGRGHRVTVMQSYNSTAPKTAAKKRGKGTHREPPGERDWNNPSPPPECPPLQCPEK
jgi:hypothetical protein